ncbi:MAG: hypothetical protein ACI9BD_001131, partial [Candidatus Marinamargulisbacteria bacterium]
MAPKDIVVIVASNSQKTSLLNQFAASDTPIARPEICTLDEFLVAARGGQVTNDKGLDHVLISRLTAKWPRSVSGLGEIHRTEGFTDQFRQFSKDTETHVFHPEKYKKAMPLAHAPRITTLLSDFAHAKAALQISSMSDFYAAEKTTHFEQVQKYLANRSVFFLGFWDLPDYQKSLVDVLVRKAPSSSFLIHYSSNADSYRAAEPLVNWLFSEFPDARHIATTPPSTERTKEVRACPTIEKEIVFIAKEILRLIQNGEIANYEDVSLFLPGDTTYTDMIQRIFHKHKIPISGRFSQPINQTAPAHFLLHFLGLLKGEDSKSNLLHFLSAPFSRHLTPDPARPSHPFDPTLIATILRQPQALNSPSVIQILLEKKHDITTELSFKSEGDDQESLREQETRIDEQINGLKDLESLVETLSKAPNAVVFVKDLKKAVQKFGVLEQILASSVPKKEQRFLLQSFFSLLSLLDDFQAIFDDLSTAPFTAQAFIRDFKTMVNFHKVSPPEPAAGVSLLGKFEGYLIENKAVFIPGCLENLWPGQTPESLFMPAFVRNQLNWPTSETYRRWDGFLFHA